jgi:predicted lipoprotein with Yx(FWY)xxD motif
MRLKGRITVGAITIAAGLGIAACGSGDSSSDSSAGSNGGAETVSVDSIGDTGDVLVNPNGAALYTPEEEANGKILCTKGCTAIWVPVTVANGQVPTGPDDVSGELGSVKRPDGTTQVTLDGTPLYSFTQEDTGNVTGDGVKDAFGKQHFVWHVVTPMGASGSSESTSSSGDGRYSY